MNILLITQLYPLRDDSSNSFALHYFVKEWHKHHNVTVLRPYMKYEIENQPETEKIVVDDIEIHVAKFKWIPILKRALINKKKLYDKLKVNPDIIVAHLYNSYLNFIDLASKRNIPIVAGIHNSDIKLLNNKLHRKRIVRALRKADGIVFRSIPIQKQFEEIVGPVNTPTFVANSGLPENYIGYAREILEKDCNTGLADEIRFVSACMLYKLKQIDKVLYSLKKISELGFHNWSYTIIGDGPELPGLKKLTQRLNLDNYVNFVGRLTRKQVFEILKKHHIFVMPSFPETFGLAYLEAMAAGCVVVGARNWGIDGIVKNEINGFLCNMENKDGVYQTLYKVIRLGEDDFLQIRKRSLETVTSFSEKKKAGEYLQFLDTVIRPG